MPDTLLDDISLVIERHVLNLTDAAATQLDVRSSLRPAVDRILALFAEEREAFQKKIDALETIQQNVIDGAMEELNERIVSSEARETKLVEALEEAREEIIRGGDPLIVEHIDAALASVKEGKE